MRYDCGARKRPTPELCAIPTILVTAYPDEMVRDQALKDGVACYLSKPVEELGLLGADQQLSVPALDRLPFFSCAGAMLVSAHDHHVFVIGITRQQLENSFENAALRPSIEALMVTLKRFARICQN
jgi:CheY-like chemotaxis protein